MEDVDITTKRQHQNCKIQVLNFIATVENTKVVVSHKKVRAFILNFQDNIYTFRVENTKVVVSHKKVRAFILNFQDNIYTFRVENLCYLTQRALRGATPQ
jgi:hypothetical protein